MNGLWKRKLAAWLHDPAEKQLILMLDQGLSNRDIAETLGISEHTVKVHLWRLFKRIGVNSRTQMLHYARVNGLLIN